MSAGTSEDLTTVLVSDAGGSRMESVGLVVVDAAVSDSNPVGAGRLGPDGGVGPRDNGAASDVSPL